MAASSQPFMLPLKLRHTCASPPRPFQRCVFAEPAQPTPSWENAWSATSGNTLKNGWGLTFVGPPRTPAPPRHQCLTVNCTQQ